MLSLAFHRVESINLGTVQEYQGDRRFWTIDLRIVHNCRDSQESRTLTFYFDSKPEMDGPFVTFTTQTEQTDENTHHI